MKKTELSSSEPPIAATVLGWARIVPFAFFSLLSFQNVVLLGTNPQDALFVYGAVILSFMAGVRWGLAMTYAKKSEHESRTNRFVVSVLPPVLAMVLWFLPRYLGIFSLSAVFVWLLFIDLAAVRDGDAPTWYRGLRFKLTAAVVVCLLASQIAL